MKKNLAGLRSERIFSTNSCLDKEQVRLRLITEDALREG